MPIYVNTTKLGSEAYNVHGSSTKLKKIKMGSTEVWASRQILPQAPKTPQFFFVLNDELYFLAMVTSPSYDIEVYKFNGNSWVYQRNGLLYQSSGWCTHNNKLYGAARYGNQTIRLNVYDGSTLTTKDITISSGYLNRSLSSLGLCSLNGTLYIALCLGSQSEYDEYQYIYVYDLDTTTNTLGTSKYSVFTSRASTYIGLQKSKYLYSTYDGNLPIVVEDSGSQNLRITVRNSNSNSTFTANWKILRKDIIEYNNKYYIVGTPSSSNESLYNANISDVIPTCTQITGIVAPCNVCIWDNQIITKTQYDGSIAQYDGNTWLINGQAI